MFPETDTIVAIDVETSGPDPFEHKLLSLALAPVRAAREDAIWYVRAEPISWTPIGRSYFERFAAEWESRALPPSVVAQQVSEYLAQLYPPEPPMLVGHNVGFDYSFLKQLFHSAGHSPRLSHRSLDTHTMLKILSWLGQIPASACNSDGAFQYFNIQVEGDRRHTALGDARATRALFLKVLSEFERLSEASFAKVSASGLRR